MKVEITIRWILGAVLIVCLVSCAGPKAIFTIPQDIPTAPAIVKFANQSENAESYEWDFGDGNSSADPNPSHRYISSGNYEITLKAMKEGKMKESKQTIQIAAPEICLIELRTEFGNMLIELFDDTPLHRDNFSKLAEEGYYNNLLFHRVMNGFMIQGGDPNSKGAVQGARLGAGGPGYTIAEEIKTDRIHTKGALAAARQPTRVNPEKASSGSQFYIVHGTAVSEELLSRMESRSGRSYSTEQKEAYLEQGGYPPLDNEYTVFGKVIEGIEVIDKIANTKTDRNDRPVADVAMQIIVIK